MREVLVCVVVVMQTANCFAGSLRTIVLSNRQAPGTSDTFAWLADADLNNFGAVAFRARLTSSSLYGLWLSSASSEASMIAPPDYGYFDVELNDRGDVAYRGYGGEHYGLKVRNADGTLRVAAAHGAPAPGISPPGNFLSSYNFTPLSLNNNGDIAFSGATNTNRGLWRENAAAPSFIAKSGDIAPADPQGRPFYQFEAVRVNDAGQVLFTTQNLENNPYPTSVPGGAYLANANGAIERLAGPGDHLVTDRGTLNVVNAYGAELNKLGDALLQTDLDTGHALIVHSSTGSTVVAHEGDPIGDEHVFYFNNPVISEAGDVGYIAAMIDGQAIPNETYMVMKRSPGQDPQVIARTGLPAPGTTPGQVYGRFGSGIGMGLRINSFGQVAFGGPVVDSTTGQNTGFGIWAQDRNGVLHLVAKNGDTIDVDDGPGTDYRTIYSGDYAMFALNAGADGGTQGRGPSFFNDRGEVLFYAVFTDGTSGIFVSSVAAVPEPSTFVVALMLSWGLLSRGRFRIR
jgi:hypothetical protein